MKNIIFSILLVVVTVCMFDILYRYRSNKILFDFLTLMYFLVFVICWFVILAVLVL